MRKAAVLGVAALTAAAQLAAAAVPVQGFTIKATYPHDPQAFTQGLFYKDGFLWESTGQYGASSVRKVELATGKVLQKRELPEKVFGEGIAPHGDNIVGITWMNQAGYVMDPGSLSIKGTFNYMGEGWGLTSDGERLYMSDGTQEIRVLDPKSFSEQRRIKVTVEGQPLLKINELEWVEGQIYANVWQSDRIARIDPFSGKVLGWIDLSGLAATAKAGKDVDNVLNGIAYDAKARRLFVTGKRWPKLFEIELRPLKK